MSEAVLFNTMSEAEQALRDMGYERDKARAIWRNAETGKTAKVVSTFGKFFIKAG